MAELEKLISKFAFKIEYYPVDEVYIAQCAELPSVLAHGQTQEKALAEVRMALQIVLKSIKDNGDELPEPFCLKNFSGEFRLRMPPEKHRKIAIEASLQGVSMNQLIVGKL